MNTAKYVEIISAIIDNILPHRVIEEVSRQMRAYREAVSVKGQWCCHELQQFAAEFWGATRPMFDDDALGQVSYQIRGHYVNFCPFCGVHLNRNFK